MKTTTPVISLATLAAILLAIPAPVLASPLDTALAPAVAAGTFAGTLAYTCSGWAAPQVLAFGQSDRQAGTANTASTKFRIGSMSKSYTSAAILKLAEAGRLTIDDPLGKWLPEYPAANLQKDGAVVTLRHLLSHESGIPAWESTAFFQSHVFVSLVSLTDIMSSVSALPLESKPGTVYAYSNTGYNLLALVVERSSGMPLEEYLKSVILPLAGTADTGVTLPDQTGLAKGYYKDPTSGQWLSLYDQAEFIDRDMSAVSGSGSLYSTAADTISWMQSFSAGKVVTPSSVALALTPNLGGYGFGWSSAHLHNTVLHWHNGALSPVGFSSEMGFNADVGFAYAILTNVNDDAVSQDALKTIYQYLVDQCRL